MTNELLNLILQYDTIIVHRHVRPDPDAYGSQGGLVEIIKASFPEKKVYAVGKDEPTLQFLRTLDVIADETYQGALVIVCDTANRERICDERYHLGEKLVKIDHHPNEDPYGDLLWVDTNASSASEIIYRFYLEGKKQGLKMTAEAARLIYAGIVGDTGRFLFPNSSSKTLQYASELICYDFDRNELHDKLYEMDEKVFKLQGYVLQHFQVHKGEIASIALSKALLKRFDVLPSEASLLVNSLRDIKGIKVWCFFIEESDQIRVRLRSKGPVINGVAKKYQGGGHPLAAGASIYEWDEAAKVLADLEQVIS